MYKSSELLFICKIFLLQKTTDKIHILKQRHCMVKVFKPGTNLQFNCKKVAVK